MILDEQVTGESEMPAICLFGEWSVYLQPVQMR